MTEGKKQLSHADKVKFVGLILFVLLVIGASIYVVHFFSSIDGVSIEDALEQTISRAGAFGILICLAIQFVQIVVAFIPGEVVQVAIGYVYGTLLGGLVVMLGAAISSAFVFWLVRKLGSPFVESMVGTKDNKLMRFLKDGKRLNATVFILYLIPGLPKDVFNYLVPLTQMRLAEFLVLSTIARAPSIFASAFAATAWRQHDYRSMVIVILVFGGLGLLGILFNQQIMTFVDKLLKKLLPHHGEEEGED
ncbi:MAG: VTT domain-containing protein [Actinomycetia bacterium]|nr:VTT domain-containing protein [Actinomycetes bacterium]